MIEYLGCRHCIHRTDKSCKAFPDGIPDPIASGEIRHDRPIDGDGGFHFFPTKEAALELLGLSLPNSAFEFSDRKSFDAIEKDCGTGAGGFKPGNTCGEGGGGGAGASSSINREKIADAAKASKESISKDIGETYSLFPGFQNLPEEERIAKKKQIIDTVTSAIDKMAEHAIAVDDVYSDEGSPAEKMKTIARLDSEYHDSLVKAADALAGTHNSVQDDILRRIVNDTKSSLGGSVPDSFFIWGAMSGDNEDNSKPEIRDLQKDRFLATMKTIQGVARAASIFEGSEGDGPPAIATSHFQVSARSDDSILRTDTCSGYFSPRNNSITIAIDGENSGRTDDAGSRDRSWGQTIVVHEIAHGNHFANTKFDPPKGEISAELSAEMRNNGMRKYAFTNELEFVSCFVEDVSQGKRMTPELWKFYDDLKGPKIRASVRKAATYRREAA